MLKLTKKVKEEWNTAVAGKTPDLRAARHILLSFYPPFMLEWKKILSEDLPDELNYDESSFSLVFHHPVSNLGEKWKIFLDWRRSDLFTPSRPGPFLEQNALKVIEPTGDALQDAYLLQNQPKDSLLLQISLSTPIPQINDFIKKKIREKTGKIKKKKDAIKLEPVDLVIWTMHIQGYKNDSEEMIAAYNSVFPQKHPESIAGRLRKNRIPKLKTFVDPDGLGADWTPGEDLDCLGK